MRYPAPLFLSVAIAAPILLAVAGTVHVIDSTTGGGVAGARVRCLDPAVEETAADESGRSPIGPCRRLRCEADGFLPAEIAFDADEVACRLASALLLSGEVAGADGSADLSVRPSIPASTPNSGRVNRPGSSAWRTSIKIVSTKTGEGHVAGSHRLIGDH